MKAVCKKLFSLMLVAILLVSAVPFQASAEETVEPATVATEAAVVEAAAEVEDAIVATTPVANADVVGKDTVYVEFELHFNGGEYRVGNLVKSKIGSRAATPNQAAVLNVLKSVIGSADGYELVRWELADGSTFTSSTTLNLSMELDESAQYEEAYDAKNEVYYPILHVKAVVEKVAKTITLKPNGGTVASTKLKVMVGEPYSYYGALPIPTRSGYSFDAWYKEDGTKVDNATPVTDLGALTAQWKTGRYLVTFEAYNGETEVEDINELWTAVEDYTFKVDNNSVLKREYNNFPNKADFTPAGWTFDGWEYSNDGRATWNAFTEGKTKITADTVIRPLLKKDIKLAANDDGKTTRTMSVTLGKRVPVLPNPGTRETTNEEGKTVNQAFIGWWGNGNLVSNRDNLSNVSAHPYYTPALGDVFVAGWKDATTVYLYIHTNGNTEEHTKLVKYYDVPVTGFDLTKIDLADIFPNYGKYDDKGDEKWGWYNPAQWENYCLGRHKYDTTEYVDADYLNPERDDVHEFYIMLIDNGNNASTGNANGNGYNDNKTTVDSSNPSTGDDIFVTVSIMAVSACAVLLMFLNKKRIVK